MRLNIGSCEEWLRAASMEFADDFERAGYEMPSRMRFAIAFPSTGRFGKRVGECWADDISRDHTHEIFIRADRDDPIEVLSILVHEIVHALVGSAAKHGPLFRKCALAIGLEGPMRHTTASPPLVDRLTEIAGKIGPLPHAALDWTKRPKQTTRLLKAQCLCGYTARVARLWVDRLGAPHCPRHGEMTLEGSP